MLIVVTQFRPQSLSRGAAWKGEGAGLCGAWALDPQPQHRLGHRGSCPLPQRKNEIAAERRSEPDDAAGGGGQVSGRWGGGGGVGNLFSKGPGGKYFRLCGLGHLCGWRKTLLSLYPGLSPSTVPTI